MTQFRYLLLFVFWLPLGSSVWAMDERRNVDPWEPMNRKVFAFNETLDKYVLKPVARGYRFITPDPVERGVTNFIFNIYEFNTIINSLLQGRPGNAIYTGGRFLVNTTIGIGGLFDVATGMGIEQRMADFGQTLAVWGVDQGPYLMLPVLGPRTVRSSAGYLFDTYTSIPALIDEPEIAYTFWTVEAVDIRAQLIKADELVSGDRYIFIRNAYLHRREAFINGGKVDDSFSDFESGEEYEDF